jgi:hypothetical protein
MPSDGAAHFLAINGHCWFLLFQSGTLKCEFIPTQLVRATTRYQNVCSIYRVGVILSEHGFYVKRFSGQF